MSVHSVERFAFDRVFSNMEPSATWSAADQYLEIASLRAELQAVHAAQAEAEQQARAAGYAAGIGDARIERDAALLSAVDAVHGAIEALDDQLASMTRKLTAEAAEMALAAGELIAARTIEQAPTSAIDDAIARALDQVARGTELRIRVHTNLLPAMELRIAQRRDGERRMLKLMLNGDDSLAPGDAVIDWDQGGIRLDVDTRRAAIATEMAGLIEAMARG